MESTSKMDLINKLFKSPEFYYKAHLVSARKLLKTRNPLAHPSIPKRGCLSHLARWVFPAWGRKGGALKKDAFFCQHYLKAFTLLEMLFVLLLTSIVISLAFAYFNTFQRYLQSQNKVTTYEMQILRFESLMYYDFDRAKALKFEYNVLSFSETNVEYEFNDKNIIRYQNDATDTLWANKIEYDFFISQKQNNYNTSLIVEISDFKNRQRVYAFTKHNDERTKFENYISQK